MLSVNVPTIGTGCIINGCIPESHFSAVRTKPQVHMHAEYVKLEANGQDVDYNKIMNKGSN
jgi:pyruvate/2-oxoglutarate dehydrogenase complex dihydrolipoamide dehydrogenase (E3) component